MFDAVQLEGHGQVRIDRSRDALLTDFGKATLDDRYLLPGESYQDLFARVASAYGDDAAHAQRIYDYISRLWFMPATPVLSNGGTTRGLPISCFLNEASDSLDGIVGLWNENVWLAAKGGGIGSYWGNLRGIGEKVGRNGKTSGVIPFIRVMDSLTLAISQGSLRRGSAACYLPVNHPEIEEFLEMRRPTGGDPNRKALNLHQGVLIPDAFMRAVEADEEWALVSPKDGALMKKVSARSLWIRILTARIETGEPYIIYSDHVNNARPEHQKLAGLEVKTSNLCSEITLPTGIDQHGEQRTAVCCLSSLNLETWFEWKDEAQFIPDVMRFLDNVLQSFIDTAPDTMARARYSAMRERSVGLGVMGYHSFLQALNVPFESVVAKVWNMRMFKHIRAQADTASRLLAEERGPCPDAAEYGFMERFSNKMAIAPTASISIICGGASPGIEPIAANVYNHKTLSGSFIVRNPYLKKVLAKHGRDDDDTWTTVTVNKGSVQHLDFLTEQEKATFKTAFELDQRWVVEHAADRTPYICQSQSVNIFLPANVHKRDLHQIHMTAWKKGVKSLYYCRSLSIQRADAISEKVAPQAALGVAAPANDQAQLPLVAAVPAATNNYEECLACQ
ncbi:MAG: ribonucleoside-diphosphate reductase subunit alpha [Roseomonas sp.]|nr:ribonucleoside-diphosphate reductase subunit alpha [Roseomonas sp.]MCA3309615.1 ribonucleoside-diphosphate reductase subunit alpha [Roseomonas sp.]MCA3311551.1 ribonucleoside-diphosphate reductase subunit alpha [Roseomonas sp.]MCA3318379.1 ribonucleoside-diphosphate reductase subunit alpha [Roseomonas sp.]MCA3320137.1 ribonucleoside-diphosphate reductase subunit alpha [Roseomonas sp.]